MDSTATQIGSAIVRLFQSLADGSSAIWHLAPGRLLVRARILFYTVCLLRVPGLRVGALILAPKGVMDVYPRPKMLSGIEEAHGKQFSKDNMLIVF